MQAWNSDPNASGSRTWPKEEIEESIDLRVDSIPNDETYTEKTCDYQRFFFFLKKKKKNDSPEDNILSEKAVKKIHEADNCELHDIQQRTNKVQCQRCYSYIEAGFQVCPCGGQLNMSEEMLSSIRQTFKQLIAGAHSKESEEPDMVSSHGKSIHWRWSVESKLADNVLVGDIKVEVERRNLRIFVSGFRTHVVATVCATGGHALRVARAFF